MKVKTFRARTMSEALERVRRSFGAGAVIIYTKTIRAPGVMGLFGRQIVEIAAATEIPGRAGDPPAGPAEAPRRIATRAHLPETYRRHEPAKPAGTNDELAKLRAEIQGIRSALDELVRSNCPPGVAGLPEPLVETYVMLTRRGVDEQWAAEMVRGVAAEFSESNPPAQDAVRERVTARLAEQVRTAGPIELHPTGRRVVMLVGPTGVGKTTTIAKLAANFKVRSRRRVALITIDTYRIAAVQQLQTIADIIKVPVRTVLTVGDFKEALADLRDYDLVLVDTAGRSQRDEMKMNELKAFISTAGADEVHLVVSATAGTENLKDVVGRFKGAAPNRLLVTKVDEAEGLGKLANLARETRLPMSYLTTGQDIPDDIEVAVATRVAAMTWER